MQLKYSHLLRSFSGLHFESDKQQIVGDGEVKLIDRKYSHSVCLEFGYEHDDRLKTLCLH
jgi:hypothetical protein